MELLSEVGDKKEGGLEWDVTAGLDESARTADLSGRKRLSLEKLYTYKDQ